VQLAPPVVTPVQLVGIVTLPQQYGVDPLHSLPPVQAIDTEPSGQSVAQVKEAPPSPGVAQQTCPLSHVVEPQASPPSPGGVVVSVPLVVSLPVVVSPPVFVSVLEVVSPLLVSPPLDVSEGEPESVSVEPPLSLLPPQPTTRPRKSEA
jgi:hypothetical protein